MRAARAARLFFFMQPIKFVALSLPLMSSMLKAMLQEPIFNDVALKVSGEGVTRTNKIRATMLQVFESLSKTCSMLPQQNVALKIALCTLLHQATFNATMLR